MDNTKFLKSLNRLTIALIILDIITTYISLMYGNFEANILYRLSWSIIFFIIKFMVAVWFLIWEKKFEFIWKEEFYAFTYYYILVISLLIWVNMSNVVLLLDK